MNEKHQLTFTDPSTQNISRVDEYIGGNPPIRRHGALPEINQGLPEGYAYVPIIQQATVSYNPDTHKLVRMAQPTAQEDGWEVVALTPAEIEERQPTVGQQLAAARSDMSGLIGTLPVESRAKFAETRAGIEKLLDIGDIEAAHYTLNQIITDTEAEAAVKTTLLGALSNFLPAS